MRELFSAKSSVVHPLAWVIEPLESEPTLLVKPMFGGKAVYLHARFVLFLVAKREPWRGVLLPTSREHQASLIADRPSLSPHSVLGKWLYLPEAVASFERDAAWVVGRIRARDPRIGIEPGQKTRRRHRASADFGQRG